MAQLSQGTLRTVVLAAFLAGPGLVAPSSAQQTPPAVSATAPTAAPSAPLVHGDTPPSVGAPSPSPDTVTAPAAPVAAAATEPVLLDTGAGTGSGTGGQQDPNLPHNLSPWGMFMAADWVVKAVMIGLAFASLVTWTVFIVKIVEITAANRNVASARRAIEGAQTLDDALKTTSGRTDPAAYMLRSAHGEYHRSSPAFDHAGPEGVKERVSSLLSRIEAQGGRRLSRGTGLLATIGSTAPFVGLFGTVWGIMNSFIGISKAQTTNLAVVAPGIAEALLATAIGLVAAIPAVVIYNVFARAITGYRQNLGDVGAGVERLVSRDLDFRGLPAARARAAE